MSRLFSFLCYLNNLFIAPCSYQQNNAKIHQWLINKTLCCSQVKSLPSTENSLIFIVSTYMTHFNSSLCVPKIRKKNYIRIYRISHWKLMTKFIFCL